MCGIFSLVVTGQGSEPSIARFMEDLERALGSTEILDAPDTAALDRLEGRSFELVCGTTVSRLMSDREVASRLADVARRLECRARDMEHRLETTPGLSPARLESLNARSIRLRDLAWRMERDLLAGASQARELIGDGSPSADAVLQAAWHISTALHALDRLEVRGRDSAGLAILVRLEAAATLDSVLAARSDGGTVGSTGNAGTPAADVRILRPPVVDRRTVIFLFKVADEVGKIGDNGRRLRQAIRAQELLWQVLGSPGAEVQILAHTRWASNGIISIANCHPVDGALVGDDGKSHGEGALLAVLNGDIDNYLELRERYGLRDRIDATVTTDAKIIPLVVAHHLAACGDLGVAFRRAMADFQGSMAIALLAADQPGELLLAQKGSGQGLFVGRSPVGVAVASELYGLVELSPAYLKLDGERRGTDGALIGEIVRVRRDRSELFIERLDTAESRPTSPADFTRAEITTRDIDRAGHEHFLVKEIRGGPETVRKTLRGRIELGPRSAAIRLGTDIVPENVVESLADGSIRRIDVIGQGTAAVAGAGIARLIDACLSGLGTTVRALHASELSGHHLSADMRNTLVVAVSQSGTTTDTNRTVDLVRMRGARVISIVNRRDSDLVFRSDGVLYTSDGRDIEMSVASTKAFYAQVVAGELLAIYLADRLGRIESEPMRRRIKGLLELPACMERILGGEEEIGACARRFAGRRKHWAVVGSGIGRVAADEIRIKLSELCYKSIAADFTEDKKHIDLSSEPLVLVCATGTPEANIADAVKEVAIFRAHRSLPIVITEEGEDRYDEHAAEVLRVPGYRHPLAFLSAVMVGHLFGYHAARHFDRQADSIRGIRSRLVDALEELAEDSTDRELLARSITPVAPDLIRLSDRLGSGEFDSSLEVATAVRLAQSCDLLLGRMSLTALRQRFARPATIGNLLEVAIECLSRAINELARPIDAIKHQAKTVTVGTSRTELHPVPGILWEPFLASGVRGLAGDRLAVPDAVLAFLNALQPLVAAVAGGVRYRIADLDPLGRPADGTTIEAVDKWGLSVGIASRAEHPAALSGTKWRVVKERVPYLGVGQRDGRQILIVPILESDRPVEMLLLHLTLVARGDRGERLRALRALIDRYDGLVASVTERNVAWDVALIDRVNNDILFFADIETAARAMTGSSR